MVIKRILCAALLLAGLMSSAEVSAQIRWTGSDVSKLSDGEEVFLYNVGTGRFLIHGGDWGTQGRLFYNDSGKKFKLIGTGLSRSIDTDMKTVKQSSTADKYLICNVPGITQGSDNGWTNNNPPTNSARTYTIVFDGSLQNWVFTPIASSDGAYTYYMHQELRGNNYWMGAVYGDNWGNHDGDGYGYLISLSSSYDKATWSQLQRFDGNLEKSAQKDRVESVDNTITPAAYAETMVSIFNADTKVSIDDLYKWRIVTKDQLLATLNHSDAGDGLTTNLTYLINDRGFERNDYSFFEGDTQSMDDAWKANPLKDVSVTPESGQGRYGYTWGYISGDGASSSLTNNQNNRYVNNESYMTPVRLKAQFDDKNGDGFNGKVEAKFGYMEFEGVGTVSTYITVPKDEDNEVDGTGIYRISAYGFYQGPNPAYFFATTKDPRDLTTADINNPNVVSLSSPMKQVSGYDKSNKGSYTRDPLTKVGVIGAGYDFVYDKTDYRREVQIKANAGQKIYFGVVKLAATKSTQSYSSGNRTYYYDSDWVGADQFDIVYLGTENSIWFDERNINYYQNNDIDPNATYNNRAVRFHRTFAQGEWNSFVFPLPLTAVQVRQAFGDGTQVAVLHGLGTKSGNKEIIDFATVQLPAEGNAIEAGLMYIIKPQNGPLTSSEVDPHGEETYRTYYDLGNASFAGSALPATPDDSYWVSDVGIREQGTVAVKAHATYFNGKEIPKGSYVLGRKRISDNEYKYNMFHLTSPTTIKGFRGWITDDDSVLGAGAKPISINGVVDETDAIDGLTMDERLLQNGAIYDLSGRKVGAVANMSQLPKGLYIVNGKKYVVK